MTSNWMFCLVKSRQSNWISIISMTTWGGAYFRFELTVFRLGPLYSAIPFLPLFQLCKVCVTALVIFQETLLILLLTKINEFCLQWTLILNILPHYLSQVGGSQKKVGEQSTRGCHPMQKMHPELQYTRGCCLPCAENALLLSTILMSCVIPLQPSWKHSF